MDYCFVRMEVSVDGYVMQYKFAADLVNTEPNVYFENIYGFHAFLDDETYSWEKLIEDDYFITEHSSGYYKIFVEECTKEEYKVLVKYVGDGSEYR